MAERCVRDLVEAGPALDDALPAVDVRVTLILAGIAAQNRVPHRS